MEKIKIEVKEQNKINKLVEITKFCIENNETPIPEFMRTDIKANEINSIYLIENLQNYLCFFESILPSKENLNQSKPFVFYICFDISNVNFNFKINFSYGKEYIKRVHITISSISFKNIFNVLSLDSLIIRNSINYYDSTINSFENEANELLKHANRYKNSKKEFLEWLDIPIEFL